MILGADVSVWQPTGLKLPGLSFLIPRASIGTAKDSHYDGHIASARRAGIITGAYHFNWTGPVAAQVRAFLAAAGNVDLYAIDVEGKTAFDHARTAEFIDRVHQAGKKILLYHSASGFFDAGQDGNWIASWTIAPPKRPWVLWQYTSSGHVPPYAGRLDMDRFNGTLAQLRAFAGAAPGPIPHPAPAPNPAPASAGGHDVTYPVPKFPTVGDVVKGGVLYTTNPPSDADPKRIVIDPGRTMPYLGAPVTGLRIVEYVDSKGGHTGQAYFVKSGHLVNVRPAPTGATDAAAAIAAATAPLTARINALTAEAANAKLAGARGEWDRQNAGATVVPKLLDRP